MQKRFVAYLDILGFKQLVENNELDVLLKIYSDILQKSLHLSLGVMELAGVYDELTDAKLNSIIVSDSIIIWSGLDNANSFVTITRTVQSLLYASLGLGMPLRGAIVHGELEALHITDDMIKSHKSTFTTPVILGKGLTDAYQLEGVQNWSGCIISDSCIQHAFYNCPTSPEYSLLGLKSSGVITLNDVPQKDGSVKEHFCINWPMATQEGEMEHEFVRAAFSKYNKKPDDSVEVKIKNTIEYSRYCWDLDQRGYAFSIK